MISIRNVSKDYGNGAILQNVSLEIEKGEAVVIIGNSGCGKSTMLRCINRLITPESGEIYIDGENILSPSADADKIRRKMGMVYQHFNLFSHLNVLDNIILAPMKVLGIPREKAVAEAKTLLERVGMAGKEMQYPSSLSGGQKQRVAIARTLAMHPQVILFDEPTSALDPTMVDEVEAVIRDLVDEGMTCVIVTHEMRFAKRVASKVVFMAEKGIYEQGSAKEVFDHPKKPLTMRFLYHSRMLEQELDPASLDLFSIFSKVRQFLSRFETNNDQKNLIEVVKDELLFPIFKSKDAAHIRGSLSLICSETSSHHILKIRFQGLTGDPLSEPYLDMLNLKLIEHACEHIFSRKTGDVWEVVVQM